MKAVGKIPRPLFLSSSLISFFVFRRGLLLLCARGVLGCVHRPKRPSRTAVAAGCHPVTYPVQFGWVGFGLALAPPVLLFSGQRYEGEVNGGQLKVRDSWQRCRRILHDDIHAAVDMRSTVTKQLS